MQADSSAPFVSIVIPTKNNEDSVDRLMQSLLKQNYPNYEIVVVDSSTDRTPELLANYPVRLLTEERVGLNFARNTGISKSRGSIIVFIDADSTADPNWLSELVEPFSLPDVGATGGSIYASNRGRLLSDYQEDTLFPYKPKFLKRTIIDNSNFHKHRYPVGGNLAVRKLVFERVGLFDTSYKSFGADEWEFLWRVVRSGFKIVTTPSAIVRTNHFTSFRKVANLYFRVGLGAGLFCKRNMNAPIARMRLFFFTSGVFLVISVISLLFASLYNMFYLLPCIVLFLLPLLLFLPHSYTVAIERRRPSALLYALIDYALGVDYAIGMFFGLLTNPALGDRALRAVRELP